MNSPGPWRAAVGILEQHGSCSSQFHQDRLSKFPQSCRPGPFSVPALYYSSCPHSRSASRGCLISVVKVPRPKYLLSFVTGADQPCWEENSPPLQGAPAFQTKVIPPWSHQTKPCDLSRHLSPPRFTELQAGLGLGGSWQKLSGFI